MRIVLLGATSRTGLCLLTEAERRGHQIVAFTRRPEVLPRSPALTNVVRGDARDQATLRAALSGDGNSADAVISLLPGGSRRDPHLAAETGRALVTTMPGTGVRRLVVASAYPIVGDRPRLPIWILRRVLATPYADTAQLERIVSASELDWIIARLNRLTSKPATGAIHTSTGLLARPHAHSRADAAAVLLDLTEDPGMVRTAVNVSGN